MSQVHINNGITDTLCGLNTANMADMKWVSPVDLENITCQACLDELKKIGNSRTKRGIMTITGTDHEPKE